MKKAIVFGASGFIGSHLVKGLLADPEFGEVTVVVRKPLKMKHPKLKTLIGDLNTLPELRHEIKGDALFISLGTTKKKTPDQKEYYKIDHDYPLLAAKYAKENGVKSIHLVSSVGADTKSSFFYTKTKGETMEDIIALNFEQTHIFEPSVLMGTRTEKRMMEKSLIGFFKVINPLFVGKSSRFRGIEAKDIALAMQKAEKQDAGKVTIYQWKEMQKLLKS